MGVGVGGGPPLTTFVLEDEGRGIQLLLAGVRTSIPKNMQFAT